jgi:hypothetical protein
MKKILFGLLIIPFIATGQIQGYQHQSIESFDVYIALDALSNHEKETQEAIHLLSFKLKEINKLGLKQAITDSFHAVKIFMDWNTSWSAMVYHPSKDWLVDNGYIPEKEKSIEISNIKNFLDWTKLNQPFMVLHELAHAYHHRVLDFDYQPIIDAFEHAMNHSIYDSVSFHSGDGDYTLKESYATSNKMEYFAELTEAYLGQNDYFPFNREDLKRHDPKAYKLLTQIWKFEDTHDTTRNYKRPGVVQGVIVPGLPKVEATSPLN